MLGRLLRLETAAWRSDFDWCFASRDESPRYRSLCLAASPARDSANIQRPPRGLLTSPSRCSREIRSAAAPAALFGAKIDSRKNLSCATSAATPQRARRTHAPPQPQRAAALLFDLVSRAGNKSSSRRRTPYSARARINSPRPRHRRSATRVTAGRPCRPPPSPRTPTPRRPPPSP